MTPDPETAEAVEILGDMADHLAVGDLAAVRFGAAQLRRKYAHHPDVLREAGRGWLQGDSPRDAVVDLKRSLEIDPEPAEPWFLLGVAHDRLGESDAAIAALGEAMARDPENTSYAALRAAGQAMTDAHWCEGLARLLEMRAADPGDEAVVDALATAYLHLAFKGWTVVDSDEDGQTLVATARKVLRLAAGADIPPGVYPTEATHVKTGATCLAGLKALDLRDPERLAEISDLERVIESGRSRRLQGTWGEIGLSVILLVLAVFMLGQAPLPAALFLLSGAGMLIGSFQPQYRTNRIILSRRGETLGDAAVGALSRTKYGGLAYNLFLMGTYPFMAIYKMYVNWAHGWMAEDPVASLQTALEAERRKLLAPATDAPAPVDAADVVRPDAPAEPRREPPAGLATPEPSAGGRTTASRIEDLRRRAADLLAKIRLPVLPPMAWAGSAAGLIAVAALSGWLLTRPAQTPAAATVATAAPGETVALTSAPRSAPTSVEGVPEVLHTGALRIGDATISLDGIAGEEGVPAQEMARFIAKQGGTVSCQPLPGGDYRCLTPSGYDISAAALFNGAARISHSATEDYRALQREAQLARKGIWQ